MLIPQGTHMSGGGLKGEKGKAVKSLLEDFQNSVKQLGRKLGMPAKYLPVLKPVNTYVFLAENGIYTVFTESKGMPVLNMNDISDRSLTNREAVLIIENEVGWEDCRVLSLERNLLETKDKERERLIKEQAEKYIKDQQEEVERRQNLLKINPIFEGRGFKIIKDLVFVLMPFKEDFRDIYEGHIKPVVEDCGLTCRRADDIFSTNEIMEDIWEHLCRARIIISDLTGRNPNVFYETGVAHTLGKDVIIITQDEKDIPFDLRHLRYYEYTYTPPGMTKFEEELKNVIRNLTS